jgi:hypothetical protein
MGTGSIITWPTTRITSTTTFTTTCITMRRIGAEKQFPNRARRASKGNPYQRGGLG